MNAFIYKSIKPSIEDAPYEVVETKGKGHPDNIADTLAEKISSEYSKYCLDNFGVVLRHMVDKLTVLGGGSNVSFGEGSMKSPIRILLNGRFTGRCDGQDIDYMSIAQNCIKSYLSSLFTLLDVEKFVDIIDNTHTNEGPGVVYNKDGMTRSDRENFFTINNNIEKQHHSNKLRTNDTSTTVSYFPLSKLERLVLDIEGTLNSDSYKAANPQVGSDIKVMGVRKDGEIEITLCVPLVAKYIKSLDEYKAELLRVKDEVLNIARKYFTENKISISLNTRDNYESDDLYLTAIGSAIESGDEGAVGRGNRSRGVIPFSRNMSMEAPSGKNPIYHTGKLFTAIGDIISERIYNETGHENTVYLTSKMGGPISEPWSIAIELVGDFDDETAKIVSKIANEELNNHTKTSMMIIDRKRKINNY